MNAVRLRTLVLALVFVFALAGLAQAEAAGKKVVMLITQDGFEDTEYSKTRSALEEAGVSVVVAAQEAGTAKGQNGKRVECELSFAEVNVADYDAVVFIGGKGSRTLVDRPEAQRIARDAMDRGMVLGAICYSPVALAKAGVLEGRQATVADAWSGPSILKKAGCEYKNSSVVVDGKLVTANGPKAAKKFGDALVEVLGSAE